MKPKRNPQDMTLRNSRAIAKRLSSLTRRVNTLHIRLQVLERLSRGSKVRTKKSRT